MMNAIWGSQSFLNNPYDNKLFFCLLKNQIPHDFKYQVSPGGNLKTAQKIKLFFEKIFISFLLIIPRVRKKIPRVFNVIQTYKNMGAPVQSKSLKPSQTNKVISVAENFTKMTTLSAHVQALTEDIFSFDTMTIPIMIPCGHIQQIPNQVSQKKTANGLPKIEPSGSCPFCRDDGPASDFIIKSDELTRTINRLVELHEELKKLTVQHKTLSDQVEQLKLNAGNVNQVAATTLHAPVLEEDQKNSQGFIQDPVMLLCGHIHSLSYAKAHFGEITKDTKEKIDEGLPKAPISGKCGTCKSRVVTYLDTAALRNTMIAGNELLEHRRVLNNSIIALQNEIKLLSSQTSSPSANPTTVSATIQASIELKEKEEKALLDNQFIKLMETNPSPEGSSEFSCNRPWTGLTLEEEVKYRSDSGLKPIRWISFRNQAGSGSLIYYARILGFEDGSIEVRLMSGYKVGFGDYLKKFGFSLASTSKEARTTTNNFGLEITSGVFIARTPDEIKFALSLLINNNKNSCKEEPELFAFAKRLMLHPDWNTVESDEHALITSKKKDYDAGNVRRAQLKEQDRLKKEQEKLNKHLKTSQTPGSNDAAEADIIKEDAAARAILERRKKEEADNLAYIAQMEQIGWD